MNGYYKGTNVAQIILDVSTYSRRAIQILGGGQTTTKEIESH